MPYQPHYTFCNICGMEIRYGDKYLLLDFHHETCNYGDGRKSVIVHSSTPAIVACVSCEDYMNDFIFHSHLIDSLRQRVIQRMKFNVSNSSRKAQSEKELNLREENTMKAREQELKNLLRMKKIVLKARKINLSETQIEYLKSVKHVYASMILSLLIRKDCSHNFDEAVRDVMIDTPF